MMLNLDAHVHLQIIPRYAQPRVFAGTTFTDGRLGEYYDLGSRIVPIDVRQQIGLALRAHGLGDA